MRKKILICFLVGSFLVAASWRIGVAAPQLVSSAQSRSLLSMGTSVNASAGALAAVEKVYSKNVAYKTAGQTTDTSKGFSATYVAKTKELGFSSKEGATEVVISATGDCVLGGDETYSYEGSFLERFNKVNKDYSYFFRDVKTIFENDDLSVVNLETTLTTATKKMDKEFRFKGLPEFSYILKAGSIEVANIANNHIRDYFKTGYDDTVKNVKKAGVGLYGDGIAYGKTINGVKVCMLGYRVWDDSNYIRNRIKRDVEYYKNKGYQIVVVSFHWGVEWTNIPTELQQSVGRFTLDSGADLVVGHHPHVMQSIENYKGKYIVYSLGNFCYGGIENPWDKDSFVFQQKFVIKDNKVTSESKARVIPCLITTAKKGNDYKPAPAIGADQTRILGRLTKYSKDFNLIIDKDGLLRQSSGLGKITR